jgi:hypothetical protein
MLKIILGIIIVIIISYIIYCLCCKKKEKYTPLPENFFQKNKIPNGLNMEEFKSHISSIYNQTADSTDFLKYKRLTTN